MNLGRRIATQYVHTVQSEESITYLIDFARSEGRGGGALRHILHLSVRSEWVLVSLEITASINLVKVDCREV
jgi:hypothetical protein